LRTNPSKEASRELLLDYWEKPKSSLRRTQEGGIYSSVLFIEPAASARLHGAEPRVIQLLLLDLRWNRTALNEITDDNLRSQRFEESRGPYEAGLGADAELLGDAQWTWLEKNLQKI
jgi:alkaline phosphatase D